MKRRAGREMVRVVVAVAAAEWRHGELVPQRAQLLGHCGLVTVVSARVNPGPLHAVAQEQLRRRGGRRDGPRSAGTATNARDVVVRFRDGFRGSNCAIVVALALH